MIWEITASLNILYVEQNRIHCMIIQFSGHITYFIIWDRCTFSVREIQGSDCR